MKSIITSLLFCLGAVGAHAKNLNKSDIKSTTVLREPSSERIKELNPDAADVLNIIYSSCPEKLTEAMTGANVVSKIFYSEKNEVEGSQRKWQITTVSRTPFPFMSELPVATLVIEWISKPESGPIAADRGTQWKISCSV